MIIIWSYFCSKKAGQNDGLGAVYLLTLKQSYGNIYFSVFLQSHLWSCKIHVSRIFFSIALIFMASLSSEFNSAFRLSSSHRPDYCVDLRDFLGAFQELSREKYWFGVKICSRTMQCIETCHRKTEMWVPVSLKAHFTEVMEALKTCLGKISVSHIGKRATWVSMYTPRKNCRTNRNASLCLSLGLENSVVTVILHPQ